MTDLKPLRVLVLSDDLPGHFNQSRGIVAALRRTRPVEDTWISVGLRFGLMRNLMRLYLNRLPLHPSLCWLKVFYRFSALPSEPIDLILSAGGRTSFFNAWLARALDIPNIYSGSLRRLNPKLFTTVLTLEPVLGATNNIVLPIHACAVDAQEVSCKGEVMREENGWQDKKVWTLLLGGDGAGYHYSESDWNALGKLMSVLAEKYEMHWLVVGSRRTPKLAEQCIQSTCLSKVATYQWASQNNDTDLEACLGVAEKIFVSEDSMTMLTEAIYSMRPVYSLCPVKAEPSSRYESTMQRFSKKLWIERYSVNELLQNPSRLENNSVRVTTEPPLEALVNCLEQLVI